MPIESGGAVRPYVSWFNVHVPTEGWLWQVAAVLSDGRSRRQAGLLQWVGSPSKRGGSSAVSYAASKTKWHGLPPLASVAESYYVTTRTHAVPATAGCRRYRIHQRRRIGLPRPPCSFPCWGFVFCKFYAARVPHGILGHSQSASTFRTREHPGTFCMYFAPGEPSTHDGAMRRRTWPAD